MNDGQFIIIFFCLVIIFGSQKVILANLQRNRTNPPIRLYYFTQREAFQIFQQPSKIYLYLTSLRGVRPFLYTC